ncbi:MAG: hypothetical protein J6Y03_04665 [Alphaproteobacteria bacterium]|nr:hypothetical protein [Alphaproteobacteria bacterium]
MVKMTDEQKKQLEETYHKMTKMTGTQKKQFEQAYCDLDEPTFSLLGIFCKMPDEIMALFIEMLAIYEANPTEENAKRLKDLILKKDKKGEETEEAKPEYKKEWIKKTFAACVDSKDPKYAEKLDALRATVKRNYIDPQKPVPDGVPSSGMFLVGLGVVTEEEKKLLLNAQAAIRLISHVDFLHDFQVRPEERDYRKDRSEEKDAPFENNWLDDEEKNPTKIQLLEHLVKSCVNDIFTQYDIKREDINRDQNQSLTVESFTKPFVKNLCKKNILLQKARSEALDTLIECAEKLKERNPKASASINSLLSVIDDRSQLNRRINAFNRNKPYYSTQVKDGMEACFEVAKAVSESSTKDGTSKEYLTDNDLRTWSENVSPRISGLVAHRAKQILNIRAKERMLQLQQQQGRTI